MIAGFSLYDKDASFKEKVFVGVDLLFKTFFILSILGLFDEAVLLSINTVLKVGISAFLVMRFIPFNKESLTFTNFDRKLVLNLAIYNLLLFFLDMTPFIRRQFTTYVNPYNNEIDEVYNKI